MKTLHVAKGVELPLNVVTSKAAILAMTGMGKTYLARVMAEEMLKAGVQVVVADYTGVWWGLQSSASGKGEGHPVVIFGGAHADVAINEDAGPIIADAIVKDRVSAILDTSGFEYDAEKIRFMNGFARRMFHLKTTTRTPLHFFIDEADEWVPQSPQKEQIALFSIIKRIWQRGRVSGIGGTLISQRSALVNKSLLSQSEILIALRTVGPQDRKALGAWFESWGTAEQIDEFERTISNLDDHVAWWWSPKHRIFVQAKARKLETFDSGRTPDVDDEIITPDRRATVDVEKLGKRIAELAEEAKTNDPEKMKKELVSLREQFKHAKDRYVLLEERLKKREKAGTKTIKQSAISSRTLANIERQLKSVQKSRKWISDTLVHLGGVKTGLINAFDSLARELEAAKALQPQKIDLDTPSLDVDEEVVFIDAATGKRDDPVRITPVGPGTFTVGKQNTNGGGIAGGGARNILIVLAQHGVTTGPKIKALAGIAKQQTLITYLGRLKRAEYIGQQGDSYFIKAKGKEHLGKWDPLPVGPALIAHWRREVGDGGMGKIFDVLVRNKGEVTHQAMKNATGIDKDQTYITYLGRLKRMGLVKYSRDRVVLDSDLSAHL